MPAGLITEINFDHRVHMSGGVVLRVFGASICICQANRMNDSWFRDAVGGCRGRFA